MNSSPIVHVNTMTIEMNYQQAKLNIRKNLSEWSDLFEFDDNSYQIRYKTEGPLVPEDNSKIPVLILLSNPHPHSVKQGMFLSANRSGRENPFWGTLRESGYFNYDESINPEVMIKNKYQSPFRFFMAVLLPFPTKDPGQLKEIFDIHHYERMLQEGKSIIEGLIEENNLRHVICFGKLQFDSLSRRKSPDNYTSILCQGKIISDNMKFSNEVNIYLTYPTGWRFVKNHVMLKSGNLKNILHAIINGE